LNYLKKKLGPDAPDSDLTLNKEKVLVDDSNCEILTCKLNEKNMKLDILKQSNVNLKIIPEPVHLWQNLNGNNLLDLMYHDPEKWSFPFHSYVQLTMLQNHLELLNNNIDDKKIKQNDDKENQNMTKSGKSDELFINIMERSLYSARYCFVENMFKA
jgi:deoxynucleoside kinase